MGEKSLRAEVRRLRRVLAFYADPETYFGIMIACDAPCGDFMGDFDEVDTTWAGPKFCAGARARKGLAFKVGSRSESGKVPTASGTRSHRRTIK